MPRKTEWILLPKTLKIRSALELQILLHAYVKSMLGQLVLHQSKRSILVVNFNHDLLDQPPMLLTDSGQHFSFTFLHIHFQEIDPRDALFVNDLGKRAQAARKRFFPEL